jgi:YtcA family
MTILRARLSLLGTIFLVAGCQRAPSFDILGSFFPVWIFCAVAGIIFAAVAREVLLRLKYDAEIGPPVLVYPCLAALVAFVTWLIFFR